MKRQKRVEPVLLGAFEEQVMLAVVRTGAGGVRHERAS